MTAASITAPTAPVLVYDRIAQNRRKAGLLVALSVLVLIPFILAISYLVAAGIVWRVSPDAHRGLAQIRAEERFLRNAPPDVAAEYRERLESTLSERRKAIEEQQAANAVLTIELMTVVAMGLLVTMGIFFWGMASSPTSKLLVQAGAQPAGEREAEAKRILENLAIGAGLPTPKLYVIEASAPNAFAAGMDPAHAVVAVTRGALTLFDHRELEGVFAHELSHIGNHDIRLNTIVGVIALFLRIPYLLFKRELRAGYGRGRRGIGLWELALSPVGIYILFIAPLVAAAVRAAVSRGREFLADADAALLTRYPEGLMRALAKVGGAGAALADSNPAYAHFYFANPSGATLNFFSGNLMATHPPLAERIQRLVEFQGAAGMAGLENAIQAGRQYTEKHANVAVNEFLPVKGKDELAALNQGNPLGRVYRVVAAEPVPVYDQAKSTSMVLARVRPGSLLVVFDDPGKYRQVNTADQTFGYLDRAVKLLPMNNLIPAEVYDPKIRAAAEAALPPLESLMAPAAVVAAAPKPAGGFTANQIFLAALFAVVVFGGMLLLLTKSG